MTSLLVLWSSVDVGWGDEDIGALVKGRQMLRLRDTTGNNR